MKSPFLKQWYCNFQQFSQRPFARTSKNSVLEQTAIWNRPVFSINQGEEIFTERWKLVKPIFRPFVHSPSTRAFSLFPFSHARATLSSGSQPQNTAIPVAQKLFSDQTESQFSHLSSLFIRWSDDRSIQLWSKNVVTPSKWDSIHKRRVLPRGRAPALLPNVSIIPFEYGIPGGQEGRQESLSPFPKVP